MSVASASFRAAVWLGVATASSTRSSSAASGESNTLSVVFSTAGTPRLLKAAFMALACLLVLTSTAMSRGCKFGFSRGSIV